MFRAAAFGPPLANNLGRREIACRCSGLHLSPLAGRGRIASAIRVRGRRNNQLGCYGFKNTVDVAQDIVVPKAQHMVTVIPEPTVANGIASVRGVLTAIDLDDQTTLAAHEVYGVRTNRFLANELETLQRA
jgi:hypothetical protein